MVHPLQKADHGRKIFRLCGDFLRVLKSSTMTQLQACIVAVAVTYLLYHTGYVSNLNPSLALIAVAFPLSFSVNAAYSRREKALADFGSVRTGCFQYYSMVLDLSTFHPDARIEVEKAAEGIANFQGCLKAYVTSNQPSEKQRNLLGTYQVLFELTAITRRLRILGGPPPLIGRLYQEVGTMTSGFEGIRVVSDYRTPAAIRSYANVFMFLLSVLLSPYFAYLCETSHLALGLYGSAMTPLLFGYLLSVQRQLESPFDGDSDDINLLELSWWPKSVLELGKPPIEPSEPSREAREGKDRRDRREKKKSRSRSGSASRSRRDRYAPGNHPPPPGSILSPPSRSESDYSYDSNFSS